MTLTHHYRNYTNEDVIKKASEVKSLAELMRSLGLKPAGGNYANFKRKIQKLEINIDHWTGRLWNKDLQLKDWSNYTTVGRVKQHLLKLRGSKCENCELEIWMNNQIPLEIHHMDGDRTNNEISNLKLLCPNCHALTDNWRRRK